jgi:hypothetical protein
MNDTKGLLARIASLRSRLDQGPPLAAQSASANLRSDPLHTLGETVQRGAWHNQLLDNATRPFSETESGAVLPARLTASGARLLKKGKELLQALRALTDDPILQKDEQDPLAILHHGSAALIEVLLRAVQAFPPTPSVQLRLCEGLEFVLQSVEEQLETIVAGLAHRRREEARIDYVAEILRWLAVGQSVNLESLQSVAERLIDEARTGQPLRFLYAAPTEPARFAAAHGLTTAQVLARVLISDAEWQNQLPLAVMAALVHDVGMVGVPAEILYHPGPLNDEQRRLVERHTTAGGSLVRLLWPGGGWPLEAATDHHERGDGTGYPLGRKEIQLAPFVRLLAVCDVYAAMGAPRPHRPALDSRTALTDLLLMAEHGSFDRAQAERLLALSFYPVGSVVALDDGAIAVVLAVHPGPRGLDSPTRPVVHLLSDAGGQPLALPCVLDLAQQKDRHIRRNLNRAERQQALLKKFPQLI